jgi:hypothetical protein
VSKPSSPSPFFLRAKGINAKILEEEASSNSTLTRQGEKKVSDIR